MVERKESTPMREARRLYEKRKKEERKAKSGNFQTMIPREEFEEINAFIEKYNITKVNLIREGYRSLKEQLKKEKVTYETK